MNTWAEETQKNLLHKWIHKNLGIKIPRKKICDNHDAPFDFVYAAFIGAYSIIVALANRTGGKTLCFAVLTILDTFANDKCESANFGAIKPQALRCYNYIKNFLERNKDLYSKIKGDITMGVTHFINQSKVEVLVATISGVNSPHPQKVKADEVELINWYILQQALSMAMSKDGVKTCTVLGSTRKFSHGPMQRLIDMGKIKVFAWCVWEVVEKWPTDVERQKYIRELFGDLLPANIEQADGYYSWDDLIDKFITLDRETFLTEWMCQKPDSSGLIYPKFDIVLNSAPDFVLDKTKSIQIWEDFGYAKDHPNVLLFVQIDIKRMEFVVFDELYLVEHRTQDIMIEVIQKLKEHGLVDDELPTDTETLKTMLQYNEYFRHINGGWICDYHGLTEIADRKGFGAPILDKVDNDDIEEAAKLYLKVNGIPLVRKFVDERRMKFDPKRVTRMPQEFQLYSRKRLADGTYSDEPEKKDDHAPDANHYGIVKNWYLLSYRGFDRQETVELPRRHADDSPNEYPEEEGDTYTGGLLDRVF